MDSQPVEQPQDGDAIYSAPADENAKSEEVRTLYITGFPYDVKYREVYNLFRFRDGFEECSVKQNNVAFVLFRDHDSAEQALNALNGLNFDPQGHSQLRIAFAKQNSKRKRDSDKPREAEGEPHHGQRDEKRSKHSAAAMSASAQSNMLQALQYYGAAAAMNPYAAFDPYAYGVMPQMPPPPPPTRGPRVPLPPCNTLYISNLSPVLTESQLVPVFSQMEGFVRMQLLPKGDSLCAFIQFKDVTYATAAHSQIPLFQLPTSSTGTFRVEFAKNEMASRSDDPSRQSAHQLNPYAYYKN